MAVKALPTPDVLRQLLCYDAETGRLTWRHRPGKENAFWNARFSGTPALASKTPKGYLEGNVHSVKVLAHRAAWAIFYGEWPERCLDHVNRQPADNRIGNLRLATASENQRNRRLQPSTSPYRGVSKNAKGRPWRAQIKLNSRIRFLGYFDNEIVAARAYDAAAIEMHGEFAVLNFPP